MKVRIQSLLEVRITARVERRQPPALISLTLSLVRDRVFIRLHTRIFIYIYILIYTSWGKEG